MKIKAFAKINWGLRIVGQRADGYHELDTLMQGISIFDEIDWKQGQNNAFSCSDPQLQTLDSNLVLRAVDAYAQAADISLDRGVIHLEKKIPIMAGLGGGSSDAAAMLRLLQNEFHALDEITLEQVALGLGADVPYCLQNGVLIRCRGIGEVIQSIAGARKYELLLVQPYEGISTKVLFESLPKEEEFAGSINQMIDAVVSADFSSVTDAVQNALLPAARMLVPEIGAIIGRLYDAGAQFATMSGAGSCCFGVFETRQVAEQAKRMFSNVCFCECAETLVVSKYEE